ncbi:MAG: BrnT family toxin [Methylobacillus sp.]|jgi:uncharacterized DUF497 family protein|nr:BrnT family toxin [Methylobacillus sp.]
MDIHFDLNGARFVWNDEKARLNVLRHDGITFERAVEVFFDPLLRLVDAERNEETRDAVIGYDTSGRLLLLCMSWWKVMPSALFRLARPHYGSATTMIPDKLKTRLTKDRAMTTITLRIPVDVVDALKTIAPRKGMSGYQALLKAYVSEGLRRDEALHTFGSAARLAEALRRRGVSDAVIEAATQEAAA